MSWYNIRKFIYNYAESKVLTISTHQPRLPLGRVAWFQPIKGEHFPDLSSKWTNWFAPKNLRGKIVHEVDSSISWQKYLAAPITSEFKPLNFKSCRKCYKSILSKRNPEWNLTTFLSEFSRISIFSRKASKSGRISKSRPFLLAQRSKSSVTVDYYRENRTERRRVILDLTDKVRQT